MNDIPLFINQSGSASVEYVVVTVVMMAILFAPLPHFDQSLVSLFLDSLRAFQANSTYLLSLP
jgi:hypothetical protein